MQRRVRRCSVIRLRRGSLITDYEIEFDDSEQASLEVTNVNLDIVTGLEPVVLNNETLPVKQMDIGDTTVIPSADGLSEEQLCALFNAANSTCRDGYTCSGVDGAASCVMEPTSIGLGVVVAVTVCCFIFLLALVLFMCFSVRLHRQRSHRKSSQTSSFTESGSDTRQKYSWEDYSRGIAPYGASTDWRDHAQGYMPYGGVMEMPKSSTQGSKPTMISANSRIHGKYPQPYNYAYDNKAMDYRESNRVLADSYLSPTKRSAR